MPSGWAERLPSQETFLQPAVAVSSNARWSCDFQCRGMRPPGQLSPKVGPCSAAYNFPWVFVVHFSLFARSVLAHSAPSCRSRSALGFWMSTAVGGVSVLKGKVFSGKENFYWWKALASAVSAWVSGSNFSISAIIILL